MLRYPRRGKDTPSLSWLVLALFVIGCAAAPAEDDSALVDDVGEGADETTPPLESASAGSATTSETGTFDLGDGPEELTVDVVDGMKLFEGDIIVGGAPSLPSKPALEPPPDLRGDELPEMDESRSVILKGHRWPGGVVNYHVDNDFPNPERIWRAMRHWKANTKIGFRAFRGRGDSYVRISAVGAGCASDIGYTGHLRHMILGPECSRGNVIHEFGHVLGLIHEQCRNDRDDHVNVHFENIQAGRKSQFQKAKTLDLKVVNKTPYDVSSIMHYPWNAFSKNGRATITIVGGGRPSGQRRALTKRDVKGINAAY